MPAQLRQMKTGQDCKGLLRIRLWCTDDLPGLWNRIEQNIDRHGKLNSATFTYLYVVIEILLPQLFISVLDLMFLKL